MYNVTARNYDNTARYDEYFLERTYAFDMFNTATKCVDCAYAVIIDASTGEVLADYTPKDGITIS